MLTPNYKFSISATVPRETIKTFSEDGFEKPVLYLHNLTPEMHTAINWFQLGLESPVCHKLCMKTKNDQEVNDANKRNTKLHSLASC